MTEILEERASIIASTLAIEKAALAIERTAALQEEMLKSVPVMKNDIGTIKQDISEIKIVLENKYVTKEAFSPVQKLVYGVVSVIGFSLVTSLMYLLLHK